MSSPNALCLMWQDDDDDDDCCSYACFVVDGELKMFVGGNDPLFLMAKILIL